MLISNESEFATYLESHIVQRVIIDFDGVIVDSEPIQSSTYILTLNHFGINTSQFTFNKYIGKNEKQIWKSLKEDFEIQYSISELSQKRNSFLLDQILLQKPNWFVNKLLLNFPQNTDIVMVSSGGGCVIDSYLEKWELKKYFTRFYLSHEFTKPINKTETLIGLINDEPELTLVIEDSIDYALLCKDKGSKAIWVKHSLNGEDEDVATAHNLPVLISK